MYFQKTDQLKNGALSHRAIRPVAENAFSAIKKQNAQEMPLLLRRACD
jgi:hypothetical protein